MEVLLEMLFAMVTGTNGTNKGKKLKPIALAYTLLGICLVTCLAVGKYWL